MASYSATWCGALIGIAAATTPTSVVPEPQCFWVRVPPSPLVHDVVTFAIAGSNPACVICGIGFQPVSTTNEYDKLEAYPTWVDWTWESKLSVKQSLSMSNVGSIPSRPTDVNMARCDVGICSQPLKLAFTGSIPVRVTT